MVVKTRQKTLRRTGFAVAALAALSFALAPGLAEARAGGSSSMGSRGSRTYSAPAPTNTAPSATPMQRSTTPQATPGPSSPMAGAAAPAMGGRSPFVSGLMGGLLGAGIAGMLFGGGLFGGISGIGSFFWFLVQIFLLVILGRFLWRLASRYMANRNGQPAYAGSPALLARGATPDARPMSGGGGGAAPRPSLTITPADYQAFEQLLQAVQAAWSKQDLNALRATVTPEMVNYFADQLAEQASRGVRNEVTDVKLEQGDLSEAWPDGGREYATVAMRFSMIDVTRNAGGQVVDGHPDRRTEATEFWTFVRAPGARWVLSAIQQTR
jgi:predicted lipid-binding transport protein (Tim44 family)